jgi:hypothetical protein
MIVQEKVWKVELDQDVALGTRACRRVGCVVAPVAWGWVVEGCVQLKRNAGVKRRAAAAKAYA